MGQTFSQRGTGVHNRCGAGHIEVDLGTPWVCPWGVRCWILKKSIVVTLCVALLGRAAVGVASASPVLGCHAGPISPRCTGLAIERVEMQRREEYLSTSPDIRPGRCALSKPGQRLREAGQPRVPWRRCVLCLPGCLALCPLPLTARWT